MLRSFLKRLFAGRGRARPERRRERRHQVSMGTVVIDGRTLPLRNWSPAGFLGGSYDGSRREGDRADARFAIEVPGRTLEFACQVSIVRVDRHAGEIAGLFAALDARIRRAIAQHFGEP